VVNALEAIVGSEQSRGLTAKTIFDALSTTLQRDQARGGLPNSHTTVTCGIVTLTYNCDHLRFDFFAVGDSPVWKIVPARGEGLNFQAFTVYMGPVPAHQSHVYATVDLQAGSIQGSVYFGSVEIGPGESLIVASDGIPDTRIIWDDQDPKRNRTSPKLGLRLLNPKPLDNNVLAGILKAYDQRGLLIDDDASLIVVRALVNRQAESEILAGEARDMADVEALRAATAPDRSPDHLERITAEVAKTPTEQRVRNNPQEETPMSPFPYIKF